MSNGYHVEITLLEHAILGAGPATGNRAATLRYVPGNTLRGALAQRWIVEHGRPDSVDATRLEEFATIFEGDLSFGPCHAVGSSVRAVSQWFLKYGSDRPSVVDLATSPTPDPANGYEAGRGEIVGVPTVELTRTALGVDERVEDGQLFSRDAVASGTSFVGTIAGRHPWLDQLVDTTIRIRLGARRSVGGSAQLRITHRSVEPRPAGTESVVIRALSPVIVLDVFNRPLADFDAAVLARPLGCTPDQVRIERSWTRTETVYGWHTASGFPKPDDLALVIGSTAVVNVPSGVDLAPWAEVGVGARTTEGFGRLEIDPRPPETSTSGDASGTTSVAERRFEQIRRANWYGVERTWIRGLLKDALAERSTGRTPDVDDLFGRKYQRGLSMQATEELRDIVTDPTLVELDELILLVESELIGDDR